MFSTIKFAPPLAYLVLIFFLFHLTECSGYMHTSSVNYELETIRSGTWLDVEHPRKIHRLDLDAVDQQKQLEKVLLQTQKEGKKRNEEAQARHEDTKRRLKFCVAANEYFTSALKVADYSKLTVVQFLFNPLESLLPVGNAVSVREKQHSYSPISWFFFSLVVFPTCKYLLTG